jgi:hypothetical protein
VGIAQLLQHVGTQIIANQVGVPDCAAQQPLHTVGSDFSGVFSQLPTIFAFDGTHDPFQIGQRSTTGFGTCETRGDAGMQTFEFLSLPPDFDKVGLSAYWGDPLGLLHVLLLSSEKRKVPGEEIRSQCLHSC